MAYLSTHSLFAYALMNLYSKTQLQALINAGRRLGYKDDVEHFSKELDKLNQQEKEQQHG